MAEIKATETVALKKKEGRKPAESKTYTRPAEGTAEWVYLSILKLVISKSGAL
jgi:hypothetical protein